MSLSLGCLKEGFSKWERGGFWFVKPVVVEGRPGNNNVCTCDMVDWQGHTCQAPRIIHHTGERIYATPRLAWANW